ncbi:MAG: retropepsin-like aspartic protease family protein [Gammaproteobacteria bacterium]
MTEEPPAPDSPPKRGWMFATGWALLLLILTLVFNGFLRDRQNPNRLSVLQNQSGGLELRANPNGQYFAEGRINGAAVVFLLDTGATTVAVPPHIASRAGLREGAPVPIETAAGKTTARRTHIRRLELGNFIFSDLRAVIIPSEDNTVLLGMNALSELEITQQDGKLFLQKPGI